MRRPHCRADLAAVLALAAVLLGACATHLGTVVLLPEPGGGSTSLVVHEGDRQVVLDKAYDAAELTSSGPRSYASSAQDVQKLFGPALSAQPARPAQFTLYFVEGGDALTDESKRTLDTVFSEIARRPVPDIVVIGHTDQVGTDTFNDALARQRAETVKAMLVGRGIAAGNIVAVGRGKREPAIPTANGTAEARNRRVEILVR